MIIENILIIQFLAVCQLHLIDNRQEEPFSNVESSVKASVKESFTLPATQTSVAVKVIGQQ